MTHSKKISFSGLFTALLVCIGVIFLIMLYSSLAMRFLNVLVIGSSVLGVLFILWWLKGKPVTLNAFAYALCTAGIVFYFPVAMAQNVGTEIYLEAKYNLDGGSYVEFCKDGGRPGRLGVTKCSFPDNPDAQREANLITAIAWWPLVSLGAGLILIAFTERKRKSALQSETSHHK